MSTSTQWELVDPNEGVVVHISDAGRESLAAEQRDFANDRQRAEILMWTTAASVLGIALLVITQIPRG